MALVNVVNMMVLDNPANILSPFQFEITFECLQELEDDLEWKVVYVGSAQDSVYDQVLDEILVGPVPVGINKFILQVDAPNVHQLPAEEILGVTVVLVTCSYKEREFVRVGYYVNNEYQYSPEELATFQQAQAQYQQHQQQLQQQVQLLQQEEPQQDGTAATITVTPNALADGEEETTATTNETKQQQQQLPPPPQLPPPSTPLDFSKVQRHILADKPRVTKFPIPWTLNDITNSTINNNNDNHNNNNPSLASANGTAQDHAMNGDDDENLAEAGDEMEMSFVKGDDNHEDEQEDPASRGNDGDMHVLDQPAVPNGAAM